MKKESKKCTCCGFAKNEGWAQLIAIAECTQLHLDLDLDFSPHVLTPHLFTPCSVAKAFQTCLWVPQPLAATIAPTPPPPPSVIMYPPPQWMNLLLPTCLRHHLCTLAVPPQAKAQNMAQNKWAPLRQAQCRGKHIHKYHTVLTQIPCLWHCPYSSLLILSVLPTHLSPFFIGFVIHPLSFIYFIFIHSRSFT